MDETYQQDDEPSSWQVQKQANKAVEKIESGEYDVDDALEYVESMGAPKDTARKELYKSAMKEGTKRYVTADHHNITHSAQLMKVEHYIDTDRPEKAVSYFDAKQEHIEDVQQEYVKAERDFNAARELRRSYLGTTEKEEADDDLTGWNSPAYFPDADIGDFSTVKGTAFGTLLRALWNRNPSNILGHSPYVEDLDEKAEEAGEKAMEYTNRIRDIQDELELED